MKWFRKHKILTAVILILLLLICAVFVFLWSKLDLIQFADEIDTSNYYTEPVADATEEPEEELVSLEGLEQVETAPVIPEGDIFAEDSVLNILLIGTDERTDEFNTNARSDSMILVSIDKDAKTVKLISLERGMGVPILEGQYEGQYDLLTHIFRYGGSDLLTRTVQTCFKLEVDKYVRLNFHSVTEVVDAIGGIDIELTEKEAYYFEFRYEAASSTGTQEKPVAGMNHLDGGMALAFARLRAIDSDWWRVERQRRVIIAVADKLKTASLLELNDLADSVLPLIQTNLTKLEIAELLLYAPNFMNSTFDQMTIPVKGTYGGMTGLHGHGMFAPDYEVNCAIMQEFLYGGKTSEEAIAAVIGEEG